MSVPASANAVWHCALSRANPVSGADEKRIRTRNRVLDKSTHGSGLPLSEIVNGARTRFSSARN